MYIECPACNHRWLPAGDDCYLYEEGTHEVACDRCDHEFHVTTRVTYRWGVHE